MATILDGKALAAKMRLEIAEEVKALPRKPGMAVILVGDNPASRLYVSNKEKDCAECGFASFEYKLGEDATEEDKKDTKIYMYQVSAKGGNAKLVGKTTE